MSNIEIRLAADTEYERINALFNKAYDNKRPYKNFEWEFIKGPAGKAIYIIAVDTDKDHIIGTQSAIPIYWSGPNGEQILTAKSEDTYVDPTYRGMKLFDRMYQLLFTECSKAGIQAIWGFTYALKPFRAVGFDIPYSQIQGLYVLDTLQSYRYLSSLNPANKTIDKIKIAGASVLSRFRALVFSSSSQYFKVEEAIVSDKNIKFSKDKWQHGYYTIRQDNIYTQWRLVDNPYQNHYSELTFLDASDQPFLNILINIRSNGVGYVEQLIIRDDCPDSDIKKAVSQALKIMKDKGASLIRFWGFTYDHKVLQEVKILKQCGFTFTNRGTGFVWFDFNKDNANKIDPLKILLSRIYTQGNN